MSQHTFLKKHQEGREYNIFQHFAHIETQTNVKLFVAGWHSWSAGYNGGTQDVRPRVLSLVWLSADLWWDHVPPQGRIQPKIKDYLETIWLRKSSLLCDEPQSSIYLWRPFCIVSDLFWVLKLSGVYVSIADSKVSCYHLVKFTCVCVLLFFDW